MRWRLLSVITAYAGMSVVACGAQAGVIFGTDGNLGGGYRWDASPRIIDGNERSLQGGLRYSMDGGSAQAFRDLFSWSFLPSVSAFSAAIQQSFDTWSARDSATGLRSPLLFVDDTANTPVVGSGGFGGVNTDGAEIDLLAADAGSAGQNGITAFYVETGDVTLTSGTTNYGGATGGGAIAGADVHLNSNDGALYSLAMFTRLLTHELGHALGLGDVEDFRGNGFIDDNYDPADPAGTLGNSWAGLVNPLDPSASTGLIHFAAGSVLNGDPGLDTTGVNLLMESEGLGISTANPLHAAVPLTNDEFGTRQFLYHVMVPLPPTILMLVGALAGLAWIGMGRGLSLSKAD
jgi:hypothetical protein